MHDIKAGQNQLLMAPLIERYIATALIVVCTLAIRLVLDPMLGNRAPYMFFLLTVVIVTRLWGRGPGLTATLLGGIATWYFLLEPRYSFAIESPVDVLNLAAYFAVGTGISLLGEKSRSLPGLGIMAGRRPKARWARQTVVLAAAAAILAGMVLLLQRDFERTRDADEWVVHTYRVINSAESLLSMMSDAETGERDFLLTGDRRYVAPYDAVVADVPAELKTLKELTADNPRQQAQWDVIDHLAVQRIEELNRTTRSRKPAEAGATHAVAPTLEGDQSMSDLRFRLDALMTDERNLLAVRTAEAERGASRERWVLGLGSGALIVLLILASAVIEWETVKRARITQALSRHTHLLEQAHDSLLTCRLRGAIEYWSRGAEILFGYSAPEAVGRPTHELLKTQHPLGIDHVDDLLERDGEWNGELIQTAKDGRKLTVEAKWTLAVDVDGKKLVLEAHRDVTEHKRAEAQNRLLATAIEQAEETVVITDRFAKIQYANPAFTRTTGYTRDEALGQNPSVLKSGEHDAEFYRGLWTALTSGKLWRGEFTNRRKDGSLYVEQAAIAPVRDGSGEITNYIAIKSDITEHKRSETALRESEMTLRLFVRHAPAAIAMLDRDMRYLFVSRRWMADYQLGDRDLRGLGHYEVFPEVSERWKEIHRRCLQGAVEGCEEDRFPRSDGSIDWVRWEIRPWRKIDDSIGGIIIFSELITERKQAEEALKKNEYFLRESQRVGRIGSYDLDFASGRWSSSALMDEIFGIHNGYTKDVSGWLGLIHPRQREEMSGYFQQIVAENKRFEKDYLIVRPSDGAERWVSGKGELIRDGGSRPSRMIGTIQDITEQKQAEVALAGSELRYRQLFQRSESALAVYEILYDAEGNACDFRYVNINPAFERATGRVNQRVLGRTGREVTPTIDAYWINLFGQVAKTGEPTVFEHYAEHLGRYYAGIAYTPRPHHVAVSFMDFTERKRAEDELRLLNAELEERVRARTADLESANRELESFAYSVSHDLRAPLRGIDGWSLALLEDCGEKLDVAGHKYLDRVRSEAQRMGTLIDDLLHLSRVSRAELNPVPVDLTALAATLVSRLKESSPGRSVEFIVQPSLTCVGDPRLIEIALTNLLNNAVKFTGKCPAARVEFGETVVEGARAFFVRDNGVGFEMAYAKMLFAPFQRLHKTSEFPGTGIGLATVQRVIHRHGGRVWAQAKVGEGATLYFTLGANA